MGERLANVPILVRLEATQALDLGVRGDGGDVRFVTADHTTLLSHETELYDSAGTSFFWVNLPELQAGASLDFYAYAGNPAATSTSNGPAAFPQNHVGVWHLNVNAGVNIPVPDSSPNAANGVTMNMTAANRGNGLIAGGLPFDGVNDIVRITGSATDAELNLRSEMTLSAWINPQGGGTVVARRSGGGNQYQLQLEPDGVGHVLSFVRNDTANTPCLWAVTTRITYGEWHHVAVTVDNNGIPVAFMQDSVMAPHTLWYGCGPGWRQQNIDVSLGGRWANPPATAWVLAGLLDEVRVENVARSTAWLTLQYVSMVGTLLTSGMVERR